MQLDNVYDLEVPANRERVNRAGHLHRGFTLVELLVVISIIAVLISLLLPALSHARSLALRIVCASNMQQVGVALAEYSDEYRGQYPLGNTASWPFGVFSGNYITMQNENYPTWGLGMLYYSSFGSSSNGPQMFNPQPGFLPDTLAGISMIYSTQPGGFNVQGNAVEHNVFNSSGIMDNWSSLFCGDDYWVDRGPNYAVGEDYYAQQLEQKGVSVSAPSNNIGPGGSFTYYNYLNTVHLPAENPRSNPGSILVTDQVFFQGPLGQKGLTSWFNNGYDGNYSAISDHVTSGSTNFLPVGAHELYNDGAVVWVPMSQIKVRQFQGVYMGW